MALFEDYGIRIYGKILGILIGLQCCGALQSYPIFIISLIKKVVKVFSHNKSTNTP